MKGKTIGILAALAILLGALAFMADKGEQRKSLPGGPILSIDIEKTEKIVIEKGHLKTTLLRSKAGYGVEERSGYPADTAKADALVIELLGLKGRELITARQEKHALLNVADDSREAVKVSFSGSGGAALGGLVIGSTLGRQDPSAPPSPSDVTWYVRPAGGNEVYRVPTLRIIDADPAGWLNRDLLSVQAADIRSVTLTHPDRKDDFSLLRNEKGLEPEGFTAPKGKKLSTYAINGMGDALNRLTLRDALKEGAPGTEGLLFDHGFTANLADGRRYEVASAERDGKYFIRIAAAFAETEEKKAQPPEGKIKVDAAKKDPKEIADKDKERLAGWIFEVYGADNLRRRKADLFEKAE